MSGIDELNVGYCYAKLGFQIPPFLIQYLSQVRQDRSALGVSILMGVLDKCLLKNDASTAISSLDC